MLLLVCLRFAYLPSSLFFALLWPDCAPGWQGAGREGLTSADCTSPLASIWTWPTGSTGGRQPVGGRDKQTVSPGHLLIWGAISSWLGLSRERPTEVPPSAGWHCILGSGKTTHAFGFPGLVMCKSFLPSLISDCLNFPFYFPTLPLSL